MSTVKQMPDQDRISAMPDVILHTIVSLLPTKAAVRTSILSRRWTNIYTHKLKLDFDWRDIVSPQAIALTYGTVSETNVEYFQERVENVLESHEGKKIDSFRLHCCFGSNKHSFIIGDWIHFAVRKGVEDLDLAFTCDRDLSQRDDHVWQFIDDYDLPARLLLRRGDQDSKLKRLSLRTCTLRSDFFRVRFSALTTLSLCDIRFPEPLDPRVFNSWQNLDTLKLEWCLGLKTLCLDSLECLKTVVVSMCGGLELLTVTDLPKLTDFHCKGFATMKVLILKGVPNLREVHLVTEGDLDMEAMAQS